MIINLTKFVENAYGINIDEYYESIFETTPYFNVKEELYGFTEMVEKFKKSNPKYENLGDEVFEKAANIRYRLSYTNDLSGEFESELEDQIAKDIKNINNFFSGPDDDDIYVKGNISVEEVNFAVDVIDITGENEVDKLASIIVNLINAYGTFYYESLEEFYRVNDVVTEVDKIEAIESHTHWLKYFEDIYGTIYNIFRFDTSKIGKYKTLGDYDFTEEEVEDAIDELE